MKSKAFEVTIKQLRYVCNPRHLNFKTTEELHPVDEVIGQDRAVRSIDFGLSIRRFGFNIYAAGVPGTGRKSLIKSFVERIARTEPVPPDIFFVYNFAEPDHPRAMTAPAGTGVKFKKEVEQLVLALKEELPKAFQTDDYEKRKGRILEDFQRKRQSVIEIVQTEARKNDMVIKGTDAQVLTVPLVNGEEVPADALDQLPPEVQEEIRRHQKNLSVSIGAAFRKVRQLQAKAHDKMRNLDRQVAISVQEPHMAELRHRHRDHKQILDYLRALEEDVLENLGQFIPTEEESDVRKTPVPNRRSSDRLERYRVNVVVDNSRQDGAPVIVESHPTYKNLIGTLEREVRMGTLHTDLTMIRAGSVLRANGGYLIMDITDLLVSPFAYDALKRVLQNGEVKIEDATEEYGFIATVGLRPEPVAVDLKVIMSGSSDIYGALYTHDEDFQDIFKIKADFDTVTKNTQPQLEAYARYISKICRDEKLRHLERRAVAEIIEHSARMVADQTRLTLRFSDVADLIRESDYWASQKGKRVVRQEDVRQAISERIYRSNLLEERIQEMIDEEDLIVETTGSRVGQVNGLSVYHLGSYSFGKPTRITARVSPGDAGIVNIEREARLSGCLHDKGVLILSGYVHGKYGELPLALHASLCFEQSYSGVEGDSASCAELCALISALSGIPLIQSIALTGSVDQMGGIQPVGGVNEKIEGFFETCSRRGLDGEHAVIIPKANVANLMLRRDVIEAVKEGKFHVYAINNVDEALEILTGREAGEAGERRRYPDTSIHGMAEAQLREMAERVNGTRKSRNRRKPKR